MRPFSFLILLCLFAAGCVRQQPPLEPLHVPGSAELGKILADLDAQRAVARSFEARKVGLVLRGAGSEAKQQLAGGTLYYQAPGQLHLRAQKLGNAYRLTLRDGAMLFESRSDKSFYYRDANTAEGPGGIAGGRIVEELLAPEAWSTLDPKSIQVVGPDSPGAGLRLRFPASQFPGMLREIAVRQLNGVWVMTQNDLLNDNRILIHAVYGQHAAQGAILFPMEMEIHFPQEQDAFLRFSIGSLLLNVPVNPELFDLPAQLEAVRSKGFVERAEY